jgi:NitT/TauT family transport system substrate-binding protein
MAGAAGLVGTPRARAAEGALETTTVRFARSSAICLAPEYAAEELLRAEGFTDIRYVAMSPPMQIEAVARGKFDFTGSFALSYIEAIDAGAPVALLAGVHVGCYELFAKESIRSITELKGKSVGLKASPPDLLTLIAAQVGLDPARDIDWVTAADPSVNPLDLFAEGKIDAFLGFAPEPQELRARHAGHAILSTTVDRPWSQYFCCMLAGNREYVRKYPVATKRVLRAILKATDLCATEPARVAQTIVDRRFTDRYDYALQTLNEVPYEQWRDYDPEDTVRFYALRLHEAGLIKSSPQKIIAENTDWHFLNELKRELKA